VNLMPPDGNREPMDDDELIAAMADGDDAALRELFTRHAPWLAARLRAMLPAADVEDVLQESFLAVWRGAHRYRPEGSPGGWLWGSPGGRRRCGCAAAARTECLSPSSRPVRGSTSPASSS
jgi:RNA polymerase sigma-70 factor, ECF subfamily